MRIETGLYDFGRRPEDIHEVYRRFMGVRKVTTPQGEGRLWQVWPIRIGVILDTDQNHVVFFAPEEVQPLEQHEDTSKWEGTIRVSLIC